MVELHGRWSLCEEHVEVPVEEKNMYIPHQKGWNELTILERLPTFPYRVSVGMSWPAHTQPILLVHVTMTESLLSISTHKSHNMNDTLVERILVP